MAGDFLHQLGAGRFLELIAVLDTYDERAGTADHAVLVIDVQVLHRHAVHAIGVGPFQHDRQAVDSDAGADHLIAHQRDLRTHIVGPVARDIDDPAATRYNRWHRTTVGRI